MSTPLPFSELDADTRRRFDLSLSQAIAWCRSRVDPAEIRRTLDNVTPNGYKDTFEKANFIRLLRSAELRPARYSWQAPQDGPEDGPNFWRRGRSIVDEVSARRHQLLGNVDLPSPGDLLGGKLILHCPSDCIEEAVMFQFTRGYVDAGDSPPWDTWFWFQQKGTERSLSRDLLVAWVPGEFVHLIDGAMSRQTVDCVQWIDRY
jgi:hypothetical protein